jgi:hypothetical protein
MIFDLFSMRLSRSHNQGHEFDMLNLVDLSRSNILSSQYFL